MPVQIIITGDHATDAIAELQNLATALGGEPAPKREAGGKSGSTGSTTSAEPAQSEKSTSTEAPATGGKTDAKKTLSREEQDAAVEAMVAAGEKDARYDQLTKGRQKSVDDGIAAKSAKTDSSLSDMFDDEPAAQEITPQTIRDLMAKLGKDADGNPNQENLLKIRDVLTKHIPKGDEIKVGNIPEDKLAAVHADMKKLEA